MVEDQVDGVQDLLEQPPELARAEGPAGRAALRALAVLGCEPDIVGPGTLEPGAGLDVPCLQERPGEVGAAEVGADRGGAAEVRVPEIGVAQAGAGELGIAKVCAAQVRALQPGAVQFGVVIVPFAAITADQ